MIDKQKYLIFLIFISSLLSAQITIETTKLPKKIDETSGLEFYKGKLYESTGLKGKSSLREIDFKNGNIVRSIKIDKQFFGGNGDLSKGAYFYEIVGNEQHAPTDFVLAGDSNVLFLDSY